MQPHGQTMLQRRLGKRSANFEDLCCVCFVMGLRHSDVASSRIMELLGLLSCILML